MKKNLTLCLLALILLCLIVPTVYATPQTLTVQFLQQKQISLNLGKGALVSGSVSVANGGINLIIKDPNGNTIKNYSRVSSQSFSFTAQTEGQYVITLDNTYSLSSKSLSIDYSVENSFLGIPQNIIILFAVVIVIMLAAVLATRHIVRKPRNSIMNSSEMNFFTKEKRYESIVYCPKCGTLNSNESTFCKKCGKKFSIDSNTIDEDLKTNQANTHIS